MLIPGTARASHLASVEKEHHAVQGEISVLPGVMEDVLHDLGIRMGMFRADGEYMEAFRRMDIDNGHYGDASLRVARMRSVDILHAHAPDLFPAWNSRQVVAPRSSAPASGSLINATPSPCSTASQAAAPVLTPFAMSWRHPATFYGTHSAASTGGQADDSHLPMDGPEGPTAAPVPAGAGAAPAEGALVTRPEQQPAPPRHLGMGIIVDGNPTPPPRAGPGQADSAADPTARPASADPAQGPRAALIGSSGPGMRAVPPHTVWQQVFKPHRQPPGDCADRFGGPLPAWYTRGPGSLAYDDSATVVAASRHAHGPASNQPWPQPQLGKRAREDGHAAVAVGSAGLGAYDFDGDDPAHLGHQRGRPRPHAAGPRVQSHLHNQQQQYPYQGTGQLPGALTGSGPGHLTVGSSAVTHPTPGVGLPGSGAVAHSSYGSLQDVCDPAIVIQPTEPAPDAAPFGELLYGVQRMGYDLCRRAKNPSWSGPGPGGTTAVAWRATWVRAIIKVLDQLRRLLEVRSAVSKYVAGRRLTAGTSLAPSQPLVSHAQLRDAVSLLLLVAGELPPGKLPRAGIAPEALDAIDYLLCNSPFVDFDGCDPQARAILADGALRLVRLAAERGGREPSWRGVRDRALQTLVGWLVRQSELLQQLSIPSFNCTAGGQLGGLHWGPGEDLASLPSEERLVVHSGHLELLRQLAASLSVLVLRLGPPLATWLLNAEVVGALLQPQSSLGTMTNAIAAANAPPLSLASPSPSSRADALVLLHSALLALLSHASSGGPSAACLGEVCDVVLQSRLKGAAEAVLQSECGRQSADQLLPLGMDSREAQEATVCRDTVVPLLGTVYAVLLSRGALAGWAAVEGAIHTAATEGSSPASQCPLRRAWEAPADRRYRSLSLYLQAHVLRALSRMRQHHCLEAALRCELPSASAGHGPRVTYGEQLGVVGVWLRAALDCGSRPMLAALTAELMCCDCTRRLLGCRPSPHGAADAAAVGAPLARAGVTTIAAGPCGASGNDEQVEALSSAVALAIAEDLDGGICGQLAAALVSGLVRERRLGDVRAALCGLDLTWRALRRELPRTAASGGSGTASAPAAGDAGTALAGGGAMQGSGSSLVAAASGPPAGTLRAHRAMACVALASLEACAAGSLSGAFGAPTGRRQWAEQQGRVLECVAEAVVDDAAALVRWETPPTGATAEVRDAHLARWANRLRTGCSAGLLSDLAAVLARSTDCRTDYSADLVQHPGEHSVLQRCLALMCLMVLELPPPGETHTATNRLLRNHVTAAVLDHLLPVPAAADSTPGEPGHGSGCAGYLWGAGGGGERHKGIGASRWDPGGAQANLARMLHRCVAGTIRSCIAEGLKVLAPQSAQARHAANALRWLRCLLRHPAMLQQGLLERLLPPLLNLAVESLVAARVLLLSKGWLYYDIEGASSEAPHGQGQSPRLQQQQVPLALIRELVVTAGRVLVAAAGSGLLAAKNEAYSAMPGSVLLDASPLLLMEPAPRNQLRAASGFAAALLLRTCLEFFALPLETRHQKVLLSRARPPEEECSIKVRQRLASYFGNPPVLSDAERPKAIRQACGPDVLKLSAAPAAVDGADGPMKLSEAAITCIAHLVVPLEDAAYQWAEPVVEGVRQLTMEAKTGGLRYTEVQRAAIVQLLRNQRARTVRWQGRHHPQHATAPKHRNTAQQMRLPQPHQLQLQEVQQQQQLQSQQQQSPSGGHEATFGTGWRAELGSARQATQVRGVSPPHMSQAGAMTRPAEDLGAASAGRSGSTTAYSHHHQAAVGTLRNGALASTAKPSSWPAAHYVAALAIERSEDHRLRLSGCMPFADLQALLARSARAHADGASRSACAWLPPVLGQVVEAKLRSVRSNTPVLQCTLRDASVDVAHAMIVYVVGPQDVLSMVLSDVTDRRVMVGLYGAVYLDDASTTVNGATARGPARWPLRAKLSLDSKVTLNTAKGLVVEPRTAYATQLRMVLHAQDQCAAAPTMLAVTPATPPVAASPEERAAVCSPFQEVLAVGTAAGSAACGRTLLAQRYHLEAAAATIPGGGAGQFVCRPVQRGGGSPELHASHIQGSGPPGAWGAAPMQVAPAATALRIDDTNAGTDCRQKGATMEAELACGRVPAEDVPGRQVTYVRGEGSSLTATTDGPMGRKAGTHSTEKNPDPVDFAWRGILAVSRSRPAGSGHAVLPQESELSSADTFAAVEDAVRMKCSEGQLPAAAIVSGGNHGRDGRGSMG